MKLAQLKKWFGVIALAIVALFVTRVAVAEESPYVLMQQASDKLFSDIKANQSKIKQNPNYLRTIVRNDLMPYVHVKFAGQAVLGKYISSTTPEQREKFFTVFEQFIEQNYAQILTNYTDQKIEIEPAKELGTKNVVTIRVNIIQTNGAAPIKLDFKWRKNTTTGKWLAYDVSAEGASMVSSKQKEWEPTLRQKGIEALTEMVKKSSAQPVTLSK